MDFTRFLPPRSVEDIFFERVRLVIGGEVIDLPALSIEDNEAWKEKLQTDLTSMLSAVDEAGDDFGLILQALTDSPAALLELLQSYDRHGLLPPVEVLRRELTPMGLLRCVMEVWRAANPLVDIGIAGMVMETVPAPSKPEPVPTSSRRRRGAGSRASSVAS